MSDGEKVDITKIRPGDKVTLVPVKVSNQTSSDGSQVGVHVGSTVVRVRADQIAAHHPKPREFQVGDRVAKGKYPDEWVIEHIAHGRAWISRNDGQEGWLLSLDDLTLVEGGE